MMQVAILNYDLDEVIIEDIPSYIHYVDDIASWIKEKYGNNVSYIYSNNLKVKMKDALPN